ncbi:hypothetical protein VM1G_04905 [Cytospora mali]|uniref:High-affinity nicotinic acid transporter n=1 Tax=Cytospora mali TaxID=578113 RepID=A0A194VY90_CYTMA|nr:hypothetical protein VM1G_04905 [Valsa mali]
MISMCQGATTNFAGIMVCRFFLGAAEAGFNPGVLTPPSSPFLAIWITHGIGGFGITFVLPTVIYDLGISDTAISQLMTMPAYGFVFFILLTLSCLTHTKRLNPWVVGIVLHVGQIICYVLLITFDNSTAKYILIVVAKATTACFFPILWPERIRDTSGATNAGLAIGITNAITQLDGIIGPQLYQSKFGPSYKVSYCISIGLLIVTALTMCLTWFLISRKDKRARLAISNQEENVESSDEKIEGRQSEV